MHPEREQAYLFSLPDKASRYQVSGKRFTASTGRLTLAPYSGIVLLLGLLLVFRFAFRARHAGKFAVPQIPTHPYIRVVPPSVHKHRCRKGQFPLAAPVATSHSLDARC